MRFETGSKHVRMEVTPASFCMLRIIDQCEKLMAGMADPTPLAIVFDDSEKDAPRMLSAWHKLRKSGLVRKGLIAGISFADDEVLYPLQSADLLACGIIREINKGEQMWEPTSPLTALVSDAGEKPPVKVIQEYWHADNLARIPAFTAS